MITNGKILAEIIAKARSIKRVQAEAANYEKVGLGKEMKSKFVRCCLDFVDEVAKIELTGEPNAPDTDTTRQ